jgi:hypothetical protein
LLDHPHAREDRDAGSRRRRRDGKGCPVARFSITIDGYEIASAAPQAGEPGPAAEPQEVRLRITVEHEGERVHVWTLGES